jgi:ribosome recycling factor
MYDQQIDLAKEEMEKALDFLKEEFLKLRVGKASPVMIEDLAVDYYGIKTPLKQLATTNISGPRAMIVQPYDKNSLKSIEKAVSSSGLGLSCSVEKDLVRVTFPELTEERRRELVKILSQKTEEARIMIRNAREGAWKNVKELEKEGKITEDEKYKAQDELNEMANDFNEKVREMEEEKEKEIMTV